MPRRASTVRTFGFAFAIALSAAAADSEEVAGLYRAETIVTGTGEAETRRGLRVCLSEVVVKLTGDPRLGGGYRLGPLLDNAEAYVARIAYEDRMKGIPVHDEQGTRERPHFLRVTFDAARLDPALVELGLTKWSADRPLVPLFIGVETFAERFVLADGGPQGYGQRAVVVETAARLGLPVVLPAAEGVGGATFANVAEGNAAAAAMDPDAAVLSGILTLAEDSGTWDMRWRLAWSGKQRTWALREVTFDTAIRNGLRTVALVLSGNEPWP